MLAQQPLQREDAATTVPPGPGRPAHLRDRASAVLDALEDLPVADDLTMADDHTGEATLTSEPVATAARAVPNIGPTAACPSPIAHPSQHTSDAQLGRETGPAQLGSQVSHVVVQEDRSRAAGRVSEDGQRGVAMGETEPPPLRRIHGMSDEPADQEVVGHEQFVLFVLAVHRPAEALQGQAAQLGSTLELLELSPAGGSAAGSQPTPPVARPSSAREGRSLRPLLKPLAGHPSSTGPGSGAQSGPPAEADRDERWRRSTSCSRRPSSTA